MEYITMTATNTSVDRKAQDKRPELRIGKQEVLLAGRPIAQCVDEMYQRGWTLTMSRVRANAAGISCEFDFERLSALPAAQLGLTL